MYVKLGPGVQGPHSSDVGRYGLGSPDPALQHPSEVEIAVSAIHSELHSVIS